MHQKQSIGALIVCLFISLVVAIMIIIPRCFTGEEQELSDFRIDTLLADSLEQAWQTAHPGYEYHRSPRPSYKSYHRDTIEIILQKFDPNTADSITLLHLGFRPWQAKNILRYREKGGVYRQPEDLKKLYGMTDSMFAMLHPWIEIVPVLVDSVVIPVRMGHEKRDTILNLNTADTTSLQFVRGIGPYMARQIVQYRNRLGGYASVAQLSEIKGLPDSVQISFVVESSQVRPIYINRASASVLVRHPYISYEQARQIDDLHHRRTIHNGEELLKRGIFTEQELERLRPYLNYEK